MRVDRQKAAKMGLSVAQVAATVETAMLGKVVSRFHDAGEEYDMRTVPLSGEPTGARLRT